MVVVLTLASMFPIELDSHAMVIHLNCVDTRISDLWHLEVQPWGPQRSIVGNMNSFDYNFKGGLTKICG